MFTTSLFIIAKTQKQPKCSSVGEWINNVYSYSGTLLHNERESRATDTGSDISESQITKLSQKSQKSSTYSVIPFT